MSNVRDLLASFNQGAVWAALAAGLRIFYLLLSHPRILAFVGEKNRRLLVALTALLGALWPDLTSGDTSLSSASVGLALGLLAALDSPNKPPGAGSAPSGGPAALKSAGGAAMILLLLVGCVQRTPAQSKAREGCLATATAAFVARGTEECLLPAKDAYGECLSAAKTPDDMEACDKTFDAYWDRCPKRAELVEWYAKKQEACR